ncbi:MAG TPA: hypothetical protein VFQ82_07815, partial [Stellaceae bacterium]|nr:hypothetical protein [Stellaceae bacterium]
DNIVVEIKTSSRSSFEQVQQLARALENRAGWKLRVVYADLADPEWAPPSELPDVSDLLARLSAIGGGDQDEDQSRLQFLLLWSIIEAAARHRLAPEISPSGRISSSALIKTLLTEGIIEEGGYAALRQGLAVRNAIAHGFLNQPVDPALVAQLRDAAGSLLEGNGTTTSMSPRRKSHSSAA